MEHGGVHDVANPWAFFLHRHGSFLGLILAQEVVGSGSSSFFRVGRAKKSSTTLDYHNASYFFILFDRHRT